MVLDRKWGWTNDMPTQCHLRSMDGPVDRRWPTWLWAVGYASAYAPWMLLVAALTDGLLPGQGGSIAGPAQLPISSLAWAFSAMVWTVGLGWLRRLPVRRLLGRRVRVPSAASVLSGLATSVSVVSLSLAVAVRGSSPLSTVFVARASVLALAVLVDVRFGKRIGPLVGAGLILALASILLGTLWKADFAFSMSVTVPLVAYVLTHGIRLVAASIGAKTTDAAANWAFVVGEHMSAALLFVLYGGVSVIVSANARAMLVGLSAASTAPLAVVWVFLAGVFSALVGLFNGLLFVSPESNAFCALTSRCAGVAGTTVATVALAACASAAHAPSPAELVGVAFTLGAIGCLFAADRSARRAATAARANNAPAPMEAQ
jgi:hypothetical protein